MGFLSNLLKGELSIGKSLIGGVKDNPERLLLGAMSPIDSKVWGKVLGKEYEPMLNIWGGPTENLYQKAEADGIDTGATRMMNGIAEMIAGSYAGNWAGGVAGNAYEAMTMPTTGTLPSAGKGVLGGLTSKGSNVATSSPGWADVIGEGVKGIGSKLSIGVQNGSQSTNSSGITKSKLNIDQAGLNKIVQDILGSEQGLAALVQGQNTAGLYGSSTNTLMAQRFITDIAGELAKLVAESVQTNEAESKTKSKGSGAKTVICTELERQGLLNTELYQAGHSHFLSLSPQTVRGYRVWANKVVPLMQKSPRLSSILAPIANSRYEHVTGRRKNLVGWITVHVCQPICYLIGFFVPEGEEYGHQAALN